MSVVIMLARVNPLSSWVFGVRPFSVVARVVREHFSTDPDAEHSTPSHLPFSLLFHSNGPPRISRLGFLVSPHCMLVPHHLHWPNNHLPTCSPIPSSFRSRRSSCPCSIFRTPFCFNVLLRDPHVLCPM